jgi:uncharacterized protein (TIGR02217 family)
MSNVILPNFLGFGFPVTKKPMFSTIVLTSVSGKEIRIPNYSVPRIQFEIPVNHLRMSTQDFQNLWGIYVARLGPWDSFLYWDPTDNYTAAATPFGVGAGNNVVGTGDGSTLSFQLQRDLGSSVSPLYDINGITVSGSGIMAPPSPIVKVYLNGVNQPSGWSVNSAGLLTFGSAPGGGVTIQADFAYFWRVRFLDDNLSFDQFMASIYKVSKLALIQVSA